MMLTLDVNPRDSKESAKTVRAQGLVPAVFYGPKEEAKAISIDSRRIESVWKSAGETTIITLKGAGENVDTLIHDVQVDAVTGKILHVDFYAIEKGKKVTLNVPLEFTGEAPAEKAGHIVVKALHEIEIEVAPAELPHSLEVDISSLVEVGDHVAAGQIKLPASATLITGADEFVVSVTAFQEEVVEEPAAEGEAGAEAPAEGETPAEGDAAPEGEKTE